MLQKFLKVLLLSYSLIFSSFAASTREIGFDIGTLGTQGSTPSNPASGKNKLYVKDGNLKLLDSTGSEKDIGSGESDNFIPDPGAELVNPTCAAYADTAGVLPVDGTGGSPTVSVAHSATNPLSGKRSLVFTKTAANSQGQGFSCAFTIDNASKGKVLRTQFDYEISSGTYASADAKVFIYDVTNARVIEPSSSVVENSGVKESKFAEWQSSIDSVSYRLIIHVTSTSASAYSLKFDSFKTSRGPKVYGSVTTDPVAISPTFTGGASYTNEGAFCHREGKYLVCEGTGTITTPNSTAFTIQLPYNLTVDSSVSSSVTGSNALVGYLYRVHSTVSSAYPTTSYGNWVPFTNTGDNNQLIYFSRSMSSATFLKAPANDLFTSGDRFRFSFKVPIQVWSSSQQLSQNADTRVVLARMNLTNAPQSLTNNSTTKILLNTTSIDKTGMTSTANSRINILSPGSYRVSGSVAFASSAVNFRTVYLYKNGLALSQVQLPPANGGATVIPIYDISDAVAGDYYELYAYQNSGGALNVVEGASLTFLSVEKINGPSQIAASESVSARYTQTSGQSIANVDVVIVNYANKIWDSHGAVTTGASWKFTAPMAGEYRFCYGVEYASASFTQGNSLLSYFFKQGVEYSAPPGFIVPVTGTNSWSPYPICSTLKLLSGEYADLRLYQNSGGARSLSTSATRNYIEVNRVGNY